MINKILMGILKLIISLVSLLLTPIDLAIAQFIPSLDSAFSKIGSFFSWVGNLMPWGISWFGLDNEIVALFVSFTVFTLSVPFLISTSKLMIKWYDKLKP